MTFPTQETLLGIVIGGSIAIWLLMLWNKPQVVRRRRLPACPHGCGKPMAHFHYGFGMEKHWFRGGGGE